MRKEALMLQCAYIKCLFILLVYITLVSATSSSSVPLLPLQIDDSIQFTIPAIPSRESPIVITISRPRPLPSSLSLTAEFTTLDPCSESMSEKTTSERTRTIALSSIGGRLGDLYILTAVDSILWSSHLDLLTRCAISTIKFTLYQGNQSVISSYVYTPPNDQETYSRAVIPPVPLIKAPFWRMTDTNTVAAVEPTIELYGYNNYHGYQYYLGFTGWSPVPSNTATALLGVNLHDVVDDTTLSRFSSVSIYQASDSFYPSVDIKELHWVVSRGRLIAQDLLDLRDDDDDGTITRYNKAISWQLSEDNPYTEWNHPIQCINKVILKQEEIIYDEYMNIHNSIIEKNNISPYDDIRSSSSSSQTPILHRPFPLYMPAAGMKYTISGKIRRNVDLLCYIGDISQIDHTDSSPEFSAFYQSYSIEITTSYNNIQLQGYYAFSSAVPDSFISRNALFGLLPQYTTFNLYITHCTGYHTDNNNQRIGNPFLYRPDSYNSYMPRKDRILTIFPTTALDFVTATSIQSGEPYPALRPIFVSIYTRAFEFFTAQITIDGIMRTSQSVTVFDLVYSSNHTVPRMNKNSMPNVSTFNIPITSIVEAINIKRANSGLSTITAADVEAIYDLRIIVSLLDSNSQVIESINNYPYLTQCSEGFTGRTCQQSTNCKTEYDQHSQCNSHGIINYNSNTCDDICTCDSDWYGEDCDQTNNCTVLYNHINNNAYGYPCPPGQTFHYTQDSTSSVCHAKCVCSSNKICSGRGYHDVRRITDSSAAFHNDSNVDHISSSSSQFTPLVHVVKGFMDDVASSGPVCDDVCHCNQGWGGKTCNQPIECIDDYNNTFRECSGRGYIAYDQDTSTCQQYCSCDNGWEGLYCDVTKVCSQLPIPNNPPCPSDSDVWFYIDQETGYCQNGCGCRSSSLCSNAHGSFNLSPLLQDNPQLTCDDILKNPEKYSASIFPTSYDDHIETDLYSDSISYDTLQDTTQECICDQSNHISLWYGPQCQHSPECRGISSIYDNCSDNGYIAYNPQTRRCADLCTCHDGWGGTTCSQSTLCQDKAITLKCGQYGIIQRDDSNNTCRDSCTCLFGFTGALCSQCSIQCYKGGNLNPQSLCQDSFPDIKPCLCADNSIGKYCQYYNINTQITIRNRLLPSWLVDSITSSSSALPNATEDDTTNDDNNNISIKFINSLVNRINAILGYDIDKPDIFGNHSNILTNTHDKSNPKIYNNDKINRTIIPFYNMKLNQYIECYNDGSTDGNTNDQIIKKIPTQLTFTISNRIGNSISGLYTDTMSLYTRINQITASQLLTKTIREIFAEYNIQNLMYSDNGTDSGIPLCSNLEPSNGDGDDDDIDIDIEIPTIEEDSNSTIYHNNISILYTISVFIATIIVLFM